MNADPILFKDLAYVFVAAILVVFVVLVVIARTAIVVPQQMAYVVEYLSLIHI